MPCPNILRCLRHLPIGGRELAELGDGSGHDAQREIDVSLRGVAAKAEPQAGARFFGRQADGGEDVRRLDGARRASCAGGASQTLQVESNQERFALNSGKNKVRGVGRARSAAAIDTRLGHAVQQAMLELITERAKTLGVVCERVTRNFCSFAEADDARDVLRAWAHAPLVVPAVK